MHTLHPEAHTEVNRQLFGSYVAILYKEFEQMASRVLDEYSRAGSQQASLSQEIVKKDN